MTLTLPQDSKSNVFSPLARILRVLDYAPLTLDAVTTLGFVAKLSSDTLTTLRGHADPSSKTSTPACTSPARISAKVSESDPERDSRFTVSMRWSAGTWALKMHI